LKPEAYVHTPYCLLPPIGGYGKCMSLPTAQCITMFIYIINVV